MLQNFQCGCPLITYNHPSPYPPVSSIVKNQPSHWTSFVIGPYDIRQLVVALQSQVAYQRIVVWRGPIWSSAKYAPDSTNAKSFSELQLDELDRGLKINKKTSEACSIQFNCDQYDNNHVLMLVINIILHFLWGTLQIPATWNPWHTCLV